MQPEFDSAVNITIQGRVVHFELRASEAQELLAHANSFTQRSDPTTQAMSPSYYPQGVPEDQSEAPRRRERYG